MLVSLTSVLKKAQSQHYAVGAFNVNNLEIAQAIIQAAEEEDSPIILQTSEGGVEYAGMDYLAAIINVAAQSRVPVVFHLDHGKKLEVVKQALKSGYSSVMYDGSSLPFDENVHRTRQVVRWAKNYGVSVEAELGAIPGIEDLVKVKETESFYTDPEEAAVFVKETGCNALAISIGTAHGIEKSKKAIALDFKRLENIKESISIPLVLHGASSVPQALIKEINTYGGKVKKARGIPDAQIKKAISLGISKVNTDTDIRLAFTAAVRKELSTNAELYDPRKILGPARERMKKEIIRKIRILGSNGKA
ncbi:MAG: class II fructose-1,6-bisphosphate aldolase [Candidatus Jacksonbacteria bacterium]|jgi:fructose-bisphosphate aldolase, class II|nr:class II fructose-1,6-bisphosphate aldolase [Candidatus Jacksonbacteria bacterium]MBT7008777.1 class II fructose-1,6-bisphosphate aldolase [Candidatus Jacksonbacteria bacterium]